MLEILCTKGSIPSIVFGIILKIIEVFQVKLYYKVNVLQLVVIAVKSRRLEIHGH